MKNPTLLPLTSRRSGIQFSAFLVLLGLFFWLPFWAFFNLCALYVDSNLDTARLYLDLRSVFGQGFADIFSQTGQDGVRRVLGETISHTGYIIMCLQLAVSGVFQKLRPIPSFLNGMGHPEWVWYVIAVHLLLAVGVFWAFIRVAGEFGEQSA